MRNWFIVPLAFILAGCSLFAHLPMDEPSPEKAAAELPDLGPAPELNNTTWLNVDQPLQMQDLRGKVVLIDMWTFG